jgi:hypothetical protein
VVVIQRLKKSGDCVYTFTLYAKGLLYGIDSSRLNKWIYKAKCQHLKITVLTEDKNADGRKELK